MRSSIASLKENLSRIALDVHDVADGVELPVDMTTPQGDPAVVDRRASRRFGQSKQSSLPNGNESRYKSEVDHYKAEVQRLEASEAEIKRLSINYAALLKEREEQLLHLNEENNRLRRSLESVNTFSSRDDSSFKEGNGTSPGPVHDAQSNSGHSVSYPDFDLRRSGNSNGGTTEPEPVQTLKHSKRSNSQRHEKELANMLAERNRTVEALTAANEASMEEITGLKEELSKLGVELSETRLLFQEEQELCEASQKEIVSLRADKEKAFLELKNLEEELSRKVAEIIDLQSELKQRDPKESASISENLLKSGAALETQNSDLKMGLSKFTPEKNEAAIQNLKLEQKLKDVCQERDKARQEVDRLKKHLLAKHQEESEKMDADGNRIEELQAVVEFQKTKVLQLEKALKLAIKNQEEVRKYYEDELQKSNSTIDELQQKLEGCMAVVESKNIENLNLQSALGQFYAETEAKDRIVGDLAAAREELSKMSLLLKEEEQKVDASRKEKEDLVSKLSQTERLFLEGQNFLKRVEEDNWKLRRALEQSMTRINRMSVDSDFYVDRRIVIKLLVTYLQRNHSKEVLDLMVRMLGFSEEDKKKIEFRLKGGKGIVRGVLGLPGRLVGGVMGGNDASPSNEPSDHQSFADLWVDFLLKETQEREQRVAAESGSNAGHSTEGHEGIAGVGSSSSVGYHPGSFPTRGFQQRVDSDSEFSVVPLVPSNPPVDSSKQFSQTFRGID